MNIQQLSNNIDQKLKLLNQKVAALKLQLKDDGNNSEQLLKDIDVLENIKNKLEKSRSIMWQAHDLQSGADRARLYQKRLIGISLCVLSGLGLLGLLFIALTQ